MYPLKVSENGRYFVDQAGTPLFWLGTTQWGLVRDHTLEEAALILEKTAATGFAFAQVMLLGSGDGTAPNLGKKPTSKASCRGSTVTLSRPTRPTSGMWMP